MATVFEEALETLNNAQKDKIELEHLDDGTVNIHILSFQKEETKTEEVPGKSKWAKIAEEMAEENLLGNGLGEKFLEHSREFRQNCAMKDPFDIEKKYDISG